MKRHLLAAALALGALALPASALAKGAESASIQGPNLDSAITLGGGEPGSGTPLGQIAEFTGFFAEAFGQSPDPTTDRPPAGDLGPRYTITYVMPGPNGARDNVVQDVYPYATPDPVSYMRPGQSFFDGERTDGGWYVSPVALKRVLVEVGLPATAPRTGGGGSWLDGIALATIVAAGMILLLGAAGVAVLRRRPRPATG
jgi:hypothetical protein